MSHLETLLMNEIRKSLEQMMHNNIEYIDGETPDEIYYKVDDSVFCIRIREVGSTWTPLQSTTEKLKYKYRSLEMEIRFLEYFLEEMQKEKPTPTNEREKKLLGIYQAYMGTYLATFADVSKARIHGCRARVEFTKKDIEALVSLRYEEMEKIKKEIQFREKEDE